MLRILYAGNKYYNHDPAQGFSFDHSNIYDSLRRLPNLQVVYYEYDRVESVGAKGVNQELLDLVRREKPDAFLSIMYYEDLTFATLDAIKAMTTSIGFFMDDHWHFDNSSKFGAPHLSWVATTYSKAVPKYEKLGCRVIRTHLGANHRLFIPPSNPSPNRFKYDVSFVGAWYHNREQVIHALRRAGISVAVWGPGWPEGRLSDDLMVPVVHATKINIDINPPSSYLGLKPFARFFLKPSKEGIRPDFGNFFNNIREWWQKRTPMIKPRTFNCLAARSFVLTQMTHDLPEYYKLDKEIVAFRSLPELIKKIKYYLKREDERERIALAGYTRTLRDHTYEKRFIEIFQKAGLRYP
ncbi:MAG: glycosyltransferase [Candidatus Liptonbacteria bacterium]|nr:glycosyltransferase [Candidatus Liptonbacteria bacterium]